MFSAARVNWPGSASAADSTALPAGAIISEPFGHNYLLDVEVEGAVDKATGIVVNIKEIDHIVRQRVLQHVDNRLLNGPDGPLAQRPATGEALLAFIRSSLTSFLPSAVTLTALRLETTPLDIQEWRAAKSDLRAGQSGQRSAGETLVTHVYEFSASHRLHSDALTESENQDLFGKCNYPNGHGHNYVLEVTVGGPVDPVSARVIDPQVLDDIVNREVVERYDHRHLNLDIPEFSGTIPSSEIVTRMIWDRLVDHIGPPARLDRVLLRETARNFFEYIGEKRKDPL